MNPKMKPMTAGSPAMPKAFLMDLGEASQSLRPGMRLQHPDYRHSDQASLDGRAARHTNARHVVELLILLSSQIA